MYVFDAKIRVRYAETDKMGFAYYGRFAEYYEQARTEALRNLGMRYLDLENEGVFMPVNQMHIDYKRPGRYDDLLTIRVLIKEPPRAQMRFDYECRNEENQLLNTGHTLLSFMNDKGRACRPPQKLLEKMAPFFE